MANAILWRCKQLWFALIDRASCVQRRRITMSKPHKTTPLRRRINSPDPENSTHSQRKGFQKITFPTVFYIIIPLSSPAHFLTRTLLEESSTIASMNIMSPMVQPKCLVFLQRSDNLHNGPPVCKFCASSDGEIPWMPPFLPAALTEQRVRGKFSRESLHSKASPLRSTIIGDASVIMIQLGYVTLAFNRNQPAFQTLLRHPGSEKAWK